MRAEVSRESGSVALIALIALIVLSWTASRCGSGGDVPAGRAAAEPVPLILITLDTTRPDHLEPYGAEDAETPVLQSLARRGVVFERAYATTPVTLPSHASIFTGLAPPSHGVRNNGIHYLGQDATTLAEVLRSAGYRTAAFVSAAVLERRYGLDQGFEVYDDDLAAGRKAPRLVAERPAGATVTAAASWLDGVGGEPFFLWVHLFDPHALYAPPEPFAERFSGRPYDGEIAYADAEIGRLLSHPRLAGGDDALVMVIADHGESLGEHGEASHGMLAYDATLHVPWIVRLPRAQRGSDPRPLRLAHEVSQVDLLPTALDLLGLGEETAKLTVAGRSQAPAIRTAGRELGGERALYAETWVPYYAYGWARLRALRRGGWKLIGAPDPELYHTAEDPEETRDRAASEAGRASRLAAELGAVGEGTEATAAEPLSAETRARLRSLGYLAAEASAPRRASRPDPKSMIEVHRAIERAEDALYRRDFGHAASQLRAVLGKDSENLAALSDLARALAETGEVAEAVELGRRAVELAPDSAERHLALALLLARAGEDEAALAAVESSLALDSRSPDARLEQVRALYRLGRREEALPLLAGLAAEHPEHPGIQIGHAELVLIPAGDLADAEERLRAAAARAPFQTPGWLALARLLEDGRPQEALAVYREALEHQPLDVTLRGRYGVLLARRGDPAAEQHLRAAAAAPWPEVEVTSALASIELRRGAWEAAESWARAAVDLEPESAESWNQLAIALEELGRGEEAVCAYRRAVSADPGHWRSRFNLALLLRQQGRFEAAAAELSEVLELAPDHAKSHYELGLLYGGPLRDRDRALEHLRACARLEPEHPRVERVGRLLRQLGGA